MKVQKVGLCSIIFVSVCFLINLSAQAEENGQNTSWESLGPEGGWISELIQHTSNGNILYAAHAPLGGSFCRILKSTDRGSTWTELSQIYGYILCLTSDPNNSSTMYAFDGPCVHYSTDGGVTWNENYFTDLSFRYGMVDPNDSNLLHACGQHYDGSDRRVCYYRSTDGGSNWSVHYVLPAFYLSYPTSIKPDPTDSDIIYAGGYIYTGTEFHGYVYRSIDGGSSWEDVSSGTEGWTFDLLVDPTSGKVYAVSRSGVYRSTDHGDHWEKNDTWAEGDILAMDPNNTDILFAGSYDRCFKSTDGGVTWTFYTSGLFGGTCETIVIDRENPETVFLGNPAGFFKSVDGGATWTPSNSGLLMANITALKLVPSMPTTMYVAFDNNAVYKTNNAMGKMVTPSVPIWERLPEFYSCHNIAAFAIPHTDPDHVYAMEGGG